MAKVLNKKKILDGINKPLSIQETEEGKLVRALRVRNELTLRDFEIYLNNGIPAGMPGRTTHQMVWNWEEGIHPVTDACLLAWKALPETDDRHQLALRILALRMQAAALTVSNGRKILDKVRVNK